MIVIFIIVLESNDKQHVWDEICTYSRTSNVQLVVQHKLTPLVSASLFQGEVRYNSSNWIQNLDKLEKMKSVSRISIKSQYKYKVSTHIASKLKKFHFKILNWAQCSCVHHGKKCLDWSKYVFVCSRFIFSCTSCNCIVIITSSLLITNQNDNVPLVF